MHTLNQQRPILLCAAPLFPIEINLILGLGAGLFLTRYALWQGRDEINPYEVEYWIYLGIGQAIAIAAYSLTVLTIPIELVNFLFPFLGILAAMGGIFLYLLPWANWQWSPRPWQQFAILMPLSGLIPNLQGFYPLNLLAVAGFYGGLAYLKKQVQISYLSLLLIDIAVINIFQHFAIYIPFLYSLMISFSLFYVAWVEPSYHQSFGRKSRHSLRLIGATIISLTALYLYSQPGIIPGIIGIVMIFSGLGLRIRAFLYVGTATFLYIVFYQFVILTMEYGFLKWIMGLVVGLGFIWIAATFETRREKFTLLVRNCLSDLEEWD